MLIASVLAGCDMTMAPPPPPGAAKSDARAARPLTTIAMILDGDTVADYEFLGSQARIRAARYRVAFDETTLKEGDAPAKQAELIRHAVARGASALMVRPAPAPEVGTALREAQSAGVPIVLLERGVADLSDSGRVSLVTYTPFDESAGALVAAAKAAAKRDKLREDGRAILLSNTLNDPHSAERTEALRRAIEHQGIQRVDSLTFQGDAWRAEEVLKPRILADPSVTMVFTNDDHGFRHAFHLATELVPARRFTVAGFSNFSRRGDQISFAEATAVADRDEQGFLCTAFDAAIRLAAREQVPARIEIPHPVRVGTNRPTPDVK